MLFPMTGPVYFPSNLHPAPRPTPGATPFFSMQDHDAPKPLSTQRSDFWAGFVPFWSQIFIRCSRISDDFLSMLVAFSQKRSHRFWFSFMAWLLPKLPEV